MNKSVEASQQPVEGLSNRSRKIQKFKRLKICWQSDKKTRENRNVGMQGVHCGKSRVLKTRLSYTLAKMVSFSKDVT